MQVQESDEHRQTSEKEEVFDSMIFNQRREHEKTLISFDHEKKTVSFCIFKHFLSVGREGKHDTL